MGEGRSEILNIRAKAYADPNANNHDKVEIEVFWGTMVWADYEVIVDGDPWSTTATTSSAGDTAIFLGSGFDQGDTVTVKIIGDDKVVWQKDIIAKSLI